MSRRPLLALAALTSALVLPACGSQGIELASNETPNVERGAVLFAERCSGCHTIDTAGAEGSAYEIGDRERVDGPNFNVRCESKENVLYAIRNGGYSGAIMPENIVVGEEAEQVADYLAKYAGAQASAGCAAVSGSG